MLCKGPKKGLMSPFVKETLDGEVYILLEDTKNNKKIFEDIGLKRRNRVWRRFLKYNKYKINL